MLTSLSLHGFKCFKNKVNLKLAPINIFIGPNNSGKSTILQSLLLLKQTINSEQRDLVLRINGPDFDFGSYEEIVSENKLSCNFELGVTVKDRSGEHGWKIEFSAGKKGRFIFPRRFVHTFNGDVVLDAHSSDRGNFDKVDVRFPHDNPKLLNLCKKKITIKGEGRIARDFSFIDFCLTPDLSYEFVEMFLKKKLNPTHSRRSELRVNHKIRQMRNEMERIFSPIPIADFFARMSYIAPLRNFPSRVYTYTGTGGRQLGSKGEDTAEFLYKKFSSHTKDGVNFRRHLKKWFANAGIATDIKPEKLIKSFYQLKIRGSKTGAFYNISDVGFGNSQILPVVVNLFGGGQGMAHVIEQPEIHLHPKAQCELGSLCLYAKKTKQQLFIETHSFDLVTRLRRYIAEGKLSNEDLNIYYVNQRSGVGVVRKLQINQDFSFKNWPKGFFDERYKEIQHIARKRSAH